MAAAADNINIVILDRDGCLWSKGATDPTEKELKEGNTALLGHLSVLPKLEKLYMGTARQGLGGSGTYKDKKWPLWSIYPLAAKIIGAELDPLLLQDLALGVTSGSTMRGETYEKLAKQLCSYDVLAPDPCNNVAWGNKDTFEQTLKNVALLEQALRTAENSFYKPFEESLKKNKKAERLYKPLGEDKILLYYVIAHKAAAENPDKAIHLHCIDDDEGVLSRACNFFAAHPELLPERTQLSFSLYRCQAPGIEPLPARELPIFPGSISIKGTGGVDPDYHKKVLNQKIFQEKEPSLIPFGERAMGELGSGDAPKYG